MISIPANRNGDGRPFRDGAVAVALDFIHNDDETGIEAVVLCVTVQENEGKVARIVTQQSDQAAKVIVVLERNQAQPCRPTTHASPN